MSSRVLVAVVCWAMAYPALARDCAPDEPPPFTATYDVRASRGALALDGAAVIAFKRDGGRYAMSSKMEAIGLFSEQESRGIVTNGTLRPAHYREARSRRGEASATIDWSAQRVRFSDGTEVPAPASLQDRLSLLVQLASALRARPTLETMVFEVASAKHVKSYRFKRRGVETLELPGGLVEALRFERIDDLDDRLDVWLAPSRCSLPVRVRLRDHRGTDIDQRLRELRFD